MSNLIVNTITSNLTESNIEFDYQQLIADSAFFSSRPSISMINTVSNILAGLIWTSATVDQINLLAQVITDDINRARLGIYS